MKNRPLFCGCIVGFLLISICIIMEGVKTVESLHPSCLEESIKEKSCIIMSGQIYDIDVKDNYQILYLKNNSIIYQNKSLKKSKIIVYDEEKLNIKMGNQIEVTGKVSFYERERNPGNFNQELYYQKLGICGSVWAEEIIVKDDSVNKFYQTLYVFRTKWKQLLYEMLGEEEGSALAAMLLAEKSGMKEELKELYQVNGIGHILAISGLHLSIIGVGLYKIFRRFTGSFLIGGISGSIFLVLYIIMIGISVSVLRALIMFLFRVGADMTGRHYDSLTSLAFSAFVTIVWNPLYLYDGGFWLSYGAILAIILILPLFENWLFQGFWASLSIQMVTLPVILYFFYEIPVYSVFLNVIVVPLMTIVLICGLIGSLCCVIFISDGFFGMRGIGKLLIEISGVILQMYEKICGLTIQLPGARIVAGRLEIWQIIIYYGILSISIGIWKCQKQKGKLSGVLCGVILINMVLLLIPVQEMICKFREEINITMIDVGQGDGIFIRGPEGDTYLIDSGSSDVKNVGKYRIEPFLKSQGVGKIDYVFVSHGDGDHMNGILEMIGRRDVGVNIETIVFPNRKVWDENLKNLARISMENGIHVAEMKAGQEMVEGDMKFTCLAPLEVTGESNEDSMVLAIKYKEFDALFTGDVEKVGEESLKRFLVDNYQNVRWDVLKVAHHGSKNSTSKEFLATVLPSYALISAGRDNSYGHPHDETIERLTYVESCILSTQENGAISIVTDGDTMKVEGYVEVEESL